MTSPDDSIGNNYKSGSLPKKVDKTVYARAVSDGSGTRAHDCINSRPLVLENGPSLTNEKLGPRGLLGSQA